MSFDLESTYTRIRTPCLHHKPKKTPSESNSGVSGDWLSLQGTTEFFFLPQKRHKEKRKSCRQTSGSEITRSPVYKTRQTENRIPQYRSSYREYKDVRRPLMVTSNCKEKIYRRSLKGKKKESLSRSRMYRRIWRNFRIVEKFLGLRTSITLSQSLNQPRLKYCIRIYNYKYVWMMYYL